MITNMQKYSFVVFHGEYNEFLDALKQLGVLHIKEHNAEPTEEMQETMRLLADIRRTRQTLGTAAEGATIDNDLPADGEQLLALIHQTTADAEHTAQLISQIDKELQRYTPWGGEGLQADALSRLTDAGLDVKLYQCPASRFNEQWSAEGAVEQISNINGVVYFVAVGMPSLPIPDIDAEEVVLPQKSYATLQGELREAQQKADALAQQADKFAAYADPVLDKYEREVNDILQLQAAHLNTDEAAEGSVRLLEGYVPDDSTEALDKYLDEQRIVALKQPATVEDCPPVRLRNGAFSKLFEPITEMFSLPNYSELDPTPLFAPFFMLFFGLCLGDAGYGLIVFVVTLIARHKASEKMKGLCTLGVILGAATIVVSLIQGMIFGMDLSDPKYGVPESIRQYFVTDKNFTIAGYSPMMVVAIIIGIVQILFGMCVKAVKLNKQLGALYAVTSISWVVMIITLAVYYGLPAAGIELPTVAQYVCYVLMVAAGIGIFLLNSPKANIFSNIGSGVWATYNMATGLLGDTLSYIRLFALGLTGGILGGVFNQMAFQAGDALPVGVNFIVILLILLIGHSINFGLCLIGAFVHPMRLTFVEFYKATGFEGGGGAYKPFKKS